MTSYEHPAAAAEAPHLLGRPTRPAFRPLSRPITLFALTLLSALLGGGSLALAQDQPEIGAKDDAPASIREVFELGDRSQHRIGFSGSALERRTKPPAVGLDRNLLDRELPTPALVIAGWDHFPTAEQWRRWRSLGLRYVESLGHRLWLVELQGDAETLFEATGAETFAAFDALDKVAVELDRPEEDDSFFDGERQLVVVDVTLAPDTGEAERNALRNDFHSTGVEHVDRSGERLLTLVMAPQAIEDMAGRATVLRVKPGAWRTEVLMEGVRAAVRGDVVTDADGFQLTGSRILAATRERLYAGSDHDAFWNHNAAGEKTNPRWTPVAEASCIHQASGTAWHGMMSAGILLGNGWFSDRFADDPLAFRGVAPGAVLECYNTPGANAHLSSHSYVGCDTCWDRATVGEWEEQRFHAHAAAAGNSGISDGYYSLRNDSKNAMIVGNAQTRGPINPQSSAGPTSDGRLKPDITAPTSDYGAYEQRGFSIQVAEIGIRRGTSNLVDWVFNANGPAWHLGWGQPAGNFGEVYLNASQLFGGNMAIDVDPGPWGSGWAYSPLLGTETLPSSDPAAPGAPLNIQGHEDDVLVVKYRALLTSPEGLGYFDLSPIWMRCYPQNSPGCQGLTFWYSQSSFTAVGIGDGTWRTLELPVGLASSIFMDGNAYWDDTQTWAGESIQWLGLRFKRTESQPTPSFPQSYNTASGGTSGASPVVGGAYALAMEHLGRLYPGTDLDAMGDPSPYDVGFNAQPTRGMPFNSTWKALFVHTADDMIRLQAPAGVPVNPDTGEPNVYHRGPDYTTGYGRLNIQAGIDLMTDVARDTMAHRVIEHALEAGDYHQYTFEVDASQLLEDSLAATLVWDDQPNSAGTLVNNLGLYLVSPSGETYFPWSLDVPPTTLTAADIVPARQDQPNDRDNVEHVRIDNLDASDAGGWTAYVVAHGMGGSWETQKYSLVFSPVPTGGSKK